MSGPLIVAELGLGLILMCGFAWAFSVGLGTVMQEILKELRTIRKATARREEHERGGA